MHDDEFHSFLNYVIEDLALRGVIKPRPSLPPSWTAGGLRKVELESGASVRVLSDKLFNTTEERVWRRYAPFISIEQEKLTPSELRLRELILEHIRKRSVSSAIKDIRAVAERYEPLIYRFQAIYARGALPLTPNRFFLIIQKAAALGFISQKKADCIIYDSALVYSVQLALLEWYRETRNDLKHLWLTGPDYNILSNIKNRVGFRDAGLPVIVDNLVKRYFFDLDAQLLAPRASDRRIAAFAGLKYARRDKPGVPQKDIHGPLFFGADDFEFFSSLMSDDEPME
jgi:hypothetical protein